MPDGSVEPDVVLEQRINDFSPDDRMRRTNSAPAFSTAASVPLQGHEQSTPGHAYSIVETAYYYADPERTVVSRHGGEPVGSQPPIPPGTASTVTVPPQQKAFHTYRVSRGPEPPNTLAGKAASCGTAVAASASAADGVIE